MPTWFPIVVLSTLLLTLTVAGPAFYLRATSQDDSISNPYNNNFLIASAQDYDNSGNPYYALIPSNSSTQATKLHLDNHTLYAKLQVPGVTKKNITAYGIEFLYYGGALTLDAGKGRDNYLTFNKTDQRLTFIPEPMSTSNEASWRICNEANGVPAVFLGENAGVCIPIFLEKVLA